MQARGKSKSSPCRYADPSGTASIHDLHSANILFRSFIGSSFRFAKLFRSRQPRHCAAVVSMSCKLLSQDLACSDLLRCCAGILPCHNAQPEVAAGGTDRGTPAPLGHSRHPAQTRCGHHCNRGHPRRGLLQKLGLHVQLPFAMQVAGQVTDGPCLQSVFHACSYCPHGAQRLSYLSLRQPPPCLRDTGCATLKYVQPACAE